MSDETYDIEITDLEPIQYSVLMSALMDQSVRSDIKELTQITDSVIIKIIEENPEVARREYRGMEIPMNVDFRPEILEKIGLEIVDGKFVDAMGEDSVSIDVD